MQILRRGQAADGDEGRTGLSLLDVRSVVVSYGITTASSDITVTIPAAATASSSRISALPIFVARLSPSSNQCRR